MISFLRRKIIVQMRAGAANTIYEGADRAAPKETGGLLLGWWDKDRIIIEDANELTDKGATTNSWMRHEAQAQESLSHVLESSSELIGYVGDWHSHPANCGASGPDIYALKRASKQYQLPIVLVVSKPDNQLEFHAAKNGRLCRIESITINGQEK